MAISNSCGTHPRVPSPSTPTPLPSSIAQAISQLKASWHVFPDFKRAQDVRAVIRAGVSRRELAKALNVSEGTIRNHLQILDADETDLACLRQGTISRNELLRRVRGTSTLGAAPFRHAKPESSDPEQEVTKAPAEVCREILDWLAADRRRAFTAPSILGLAIAQLKRMMATRTLCRRRDLANASIDEIILSCRPEPNQHVHPAFWHADWTMSWVLHLVPDPRLCRDALEMALNRVRTSISRPDLW
jgi:hypothetical protein